MRFGGIDAVCIPVLWRSISLLFLTSVHLFSSVYSARLVCDKGEQIGPHLQVF